MLGLSIDGPGRRTADPVPNEITGYAASERTKWASIELSHGVGGLSMGFVYMSLYDIYIVGDQEEREGGGVHSGLRGARFVFIVCILIEI